MVTLTGTFTRLDGTPAIGTVRVTPSRSPIMDPDGKIVISGPQTFPLDKDGKLATEIPASNDPDLGPPFTYAIDVNLTHANWKISKVWIPYGSTTVDLSEIADYTPVPGVATRVVTIPADGADGQVLVWDGVSFSWDFPPEGPQGPKGDLDAEQLVGAPRLTNKVHDITWTDDGNATIESQTPRLATFTATAQNGFIRWNDIVAPGAIYYVSAEVKTTSDQVFFGASLDSIYHSGSGGWERLTGLAAPSSNAYFRVRDARSSGWDQIEVRDPVLIDLTAVFGAGREPTKEYMDALLAKHGHYIGGVDQFAVGDALQALTVAGPGMTVRHDTSVGERVLLDHPGGSVMIWGNTGVRDISSLLANGWRTPAAGIRLRRVGQTVTLEGRLDGSDATSNVFLTLPPGFGFIGGSYTLGGVLRGGDLVMRVGGTLETSLRLANLDIMHSWSTTPEWPTTLPGLPA